MPATNMCFFLLTPFLSDQTNLNAYFYIFIYQVRLDNVSEYQKVVDAEWNILYDKLDRIQKSGATVVLSKLPIGDVATQV